MLDLHNWPNKYFRVLLALFIYGALALPCPPLAYTDTAKRATSMPTETSNILNEHTRPELFKDTPPEKNDHSNSHIQSSSDIESSTVFWFKSLIRTIFVLGGIIALAYLLLNKGLPKLNKLTGIQHKKTLMVKEKILLDAKHALFIVEHEQRRFLVGTGDAQTTLLTELTKPQTDFISPQ